MLVSFELTMPNINSWNGKWTGAPNKYYHIRAITKEIVNKMFYNTEAEATKPKVNYYYNFGNGWGANITAEVVTAKEANKRRKVSSGFCGYEWMVDSIILNNEIVCP